MAVVPQARRRGVGKALMSQLLSEARRRDEQRVELEVIAKNEPAVALYKGLGFQVMRRLKSYHCNQPVESTAPLERIDLAEMARLLNCFGPPDLPWQISGWSLAQLGTPYQAYRLEQACAAISSPEERRVNLRSMLVPPGDPGQGVRLLRALFARFEGKTWHVPAIFPEEFSQVFRQAGFEPGQLSQLQMELFIAQ
jgi:N-acetylglutamate synthase-like GNAT family acetyltransferase